MHNQRDLELILRSRVPIVVIETRDESRLLDLAVYAPQWAGFVEHALKWPDLEEAVWWIHAHTKDDQWSVNREIREIWNAAVSQRTPLSGEDLMAGGVDVNWFHRVYGSLKKARWEKLNRSAKYASGGGGHKRAQLFGEAMFGTQQFKKQLIERIREKRHQDSVRVYARLEEAQVQRMTR